MNSFLRWNLLVLVAVTMPAIAQSDPAVDHAAMGHGAPAAPTKVDEDTDEASTAASPSPPEEVDHAAMGHGGPTPRTEEVDHAAMGHAMPTEEVDHAAMGHDVPPAPPEEVDHAAMGHGATPSPPTPPDHAGMHHAPSGAAGALPATPIPEVTPADRAAAVRPAGGHLPHDNKVHQFVLIDRLEAAWADGERSQAWEVQAWRGTDLDRLWLRSEGERAGGHTEGADIELLYGRSVSPWWDLVAGVRHEFGEAPSQTMAAFGVQGLAPYKFEFAATAYVGSSGQTALDLDAEYDTLLTNRLILQWTAEAEFWGRDDARRGIGSGLNSVEAGLRLRYEIRREFAPYVGIVWERRFGGAADAARLDGDDTSETRVVAGLRFWF
jgi:copper resistance protein B